MYDTELRVWGSTTSQGKDARDQCFANFFPISFGSNFPIVETSTVETYEHVEAMSVGSKLCSEIKPERHGKLSAKRGHSYPLKKASK